MIKDPNAILECEASSAREELNLLLCRAREGSMDAYQALRARYKPLLEASVSRCAIPEMTLQEREDMREEAERIFLNVISTFDTEQDAVDFGLYAKICLRNGLVSEARSLSARRRVGIVPLESDEVPADDDPGDRLIEAERFHRLYDLIRGHLSDFENRVWWMYVSGVSVHAIAERVGKDDRSVHNAIYRIRRKLRVLLAEEK